MDGRKLEPFFSPLFPLSLNWNSYVDGSYKKANSVVLKEVGGGER